MAAHFFEEEAEARDHETEAHQRESGTNPREERALGGKMNPGIVTAYFGHRVPVVLGNGRGCQWLREHAMCRGEQDVGRDTVRTRSCARLRVAGEACGGV